MQSDESVMSLPEAVLKIINDPNRDLAWKFFVFFSRFEYALKRGGFLTADNSTATPNWDAFGRRYVSEYEQLKKSLPRFDNAVKYFFSQPPRKQCHENGTLSWSQPQRYENERCEFVRLLLMIRCVRNNLFHGGKFPLMPIKDPSRDRDLLVQAMVVLSACADIDEQVCAYLADNDE
jgi:hypothetical protein